MKLSVIIITFFLFVSHLFAQEYTVSLSENPQIKKYLKENPEANKNTKNSKALLELPFWDDFSENSVYPNPGFWQDNDVYINNTLAVNPPSIGVATLDAVNSLGKIYENADYNMEFEADSLTSSPINLDYPGNTTVFLSFYYQAQGLGDAPEPEDSLFLEFYAPEDDQWNKIWSVAGSELTDFKFVILPVNEDKYLKTNFQFRFRNDASFGSPTYPSLATNCDFWNIDYVYLNKDRTINDTVFHDIAFTSPLHSLLTNYESVPWKHFKETSSQTLKPDINIAFKNNDNITRLIDSLNFTLKDIDGTSENQYRYGGTYTPQAFQQSELTLTWIPFSFPENSNNSSDFKLTAKMKIYMNSNDSAQNNTISYIQTFKNYYAYDDGSAEAGYGIYGNGTKYGQVALKFSPLKQDYLTGVNMYFTQAFKNASQKYFWIYLWEVGDDGMPGDTIKTIEGIRPEYEDELNKFYQYVFDEPILIDGDFFIGWTQTTEDKLNIGFDYNTVNNDKVFYNIYGEWIQSEEQGSLMIRPIFGDIAGSIRETAKTTVSIYPNPAKDYIRIKFNQNPNKQYLLQIFNIQGQQVFYKPNFSSDILTVEQLPKGIYLLRISDNKSLISDAKFIKQ